LRIDYSVGNRGMANLVLHKTELGAGVQEVGGNRVLKHVEMPLALWDSRLFPVVLHEGVELSAGNGRTALREKERGRAALALAQVGLERSDLIGIECSYRA
jgi:hypothetical protein